MKIQGYGFTAAIVLAVCLLLPDTGRAGLAEPGNVIHGPVGPGVQQVTLKVGGRELAAWKRADNPDMGDGYVLRIPMDSLEPRDPDTARPGEEALIYLDNDTVPVKWITMGERGTLLYLRLDEQDTDGDGLSDREELELGSNPTAADTDGDGLLDRYDPAPANPDADGDGYDDGYEVATGTDPLDPSDMPVIYVDQANDSGIEDGSAAHPYNTVREGLAAAPDKYTVLVALGHYRETLTVSREVRLKGASPLDTLIDAQGTAVALYFHNVDGKWSSIESLTLTNAVNGINCNSASPLIRNVVLTGFSAAGVLFDSSSRALLVNTTITGNPDGIAVYSQSAGVRLVNNIVSGNLKGIFCTGGDPLMAWNLVQGNGTDYVGCGPGTGDIGAEPLFADPSRGDYRLRPGSPGIDTGDPREGLILDYTGGTELVVDDVTTILAGDRLWISDGAKMETALAADSTPTTIELDRVLMQDYGAVDGTVCSLTSCSPIEPAVSNARIDMGAFGNTIFAGAALAQGDFNGDGAIDLTDLVLVLKGLTTGNTTGLNMLADVGDDNILSLTDALYVIEATAGRR